MPYSTAAADVLRTVRAANSMLGCLTIPETGPTPAMLQACEAGWLEPHPRYPDRLRATPAGIEFVRTHNGQAR